MKRKLSVLAFSGLLAVGIAAPLSASNASSLVMGGTAAEAVKSAAEQASNLKKIGHSGHIGESGPHHRGHRGPTLGPGPALPPWLQHSRHHHRHHWRNRHHNPRPFWNGDDDSNFTLEFNVAPERRMARRAGLSSAHYRWCEERYRSYRVSDNTFQPYNGSRRQCVSPYDS